MGGRTSASIDSKNHLHGSPREDGALRIDDRLHEMPGRKIPHAQRLHVGMSTSGMIRDEDSRRRGLLRQQVLTRGHDAMAPTGSNPRSVGASAGGADNLRASAGAVRSLPCRRRSARAMTLRRVMASNPGFAMTTGLVHFVCSQGTSSYSPQTSLERSHISRPWVERARHQRIHRIPCRGGPPSARRASGGLVIVRVWRSSTRRATGDSPVTRRCRVGMRVSCLHES